VVDDEPDVEALFRQQFRRDLRAQRFVMDFAVSAAGALAEPRAQMRELGYVEGHKYPARISRRRRRS
jgi:hypothetical protein